MGNHPMACIPHQDLLLLMLWLLLTTRLLLKSLLLTLPLLLLIRFSLLPLLLPHLLLLLPLTCVLGASADAYAPCNTVELLL